MDSVEVSSGDRPSEVASDISERLIFAIQQHLLASYTPEITKRLKRFSIGEAAGLLGVSESYLHKAHKAGKIPEPEFTSMNGRRYYTGLELLALRQALEASSKRKGKFLPGRREGDRLQIWQLMNFKGGSSKSTTTIHLAHYLALRGYKVLAVDLDPQGSLTSMCGISPDLNFSEATIYDAISFQNPVPLRDILVKTYFPGLTLAPSKLILSEFETEAVLHSNPDAPFFTRIGEAIGQVEHEFDVVLIDSPPQLGFLTIAGMAAATSLIVPLAPSMLDVSSTAQFMELVGAYMRVIEEAGATLNYDHFKFLVTRHEPTDIPSQQLVSFLRTLFEDRVMSATALKSTAISDATLLKQSLYEVVRSDMTRSTYDRAKQSFDAVGSEVEAMIQQAWGRS